MLTFIKKSMSKFKLLKTRDLPCHLFSKSSRSSPSNDGPVVCTVISQKLTTYMVFKCA